MIVRYRNTYTFKETCTTSFTKSDFDISEHGHVKG